MAKSPPGLLERILATPQLEQVVPRLQPEVLHRVIERCGLEECGELVALATPEQLVRVFDLDLWRSDQPGHDEQLDPDRFGLWIEVLLDLGPAVAAQKLAGMDASLVIAALAQHVLVFDRAAVTPYTTTDGLVAPGRRQNDRPASEVGGFVVEARRTSSWDAVVSLLEALEAEQPGCFHRVMAGCRKLSSSRPEVDGLHDLMTDPEQHAFDVAFEREQRRERQGYVTPAQARAFLHEARRYQSGRSTAPPPSPVARAYFRSIEWAPPAEEAPGTGAEAVVDLLLEAGVLPQPPRALLEGSQDESRLARIRAHLRIVHDKAPAIFATRTGELAYLANTLAAGCPIQGRPFTAREASDAAAAVCNLGLENWPGAARLPDDFLVDHDLVGVFEAGWTVLHDDVAMYVADRLTGVLDQLRSADIDMQARLNALRMALARHSREGEPWRAADALDVIVILDTPAWAALAALIAECPVIHEAMGVSRGKRTRAVSASAFEFISENGQIRAVREFMDSLADLLM